jgi:hypothetical protein
VDEFSTEPAIRDRVTLETQAGPRTHVHKATIANLTTDEVWVAVGKGTKEHLTVGAWVRIIVARPPQVSLTAETSVKRIVGGSGLIAALWRPEMWISHSRRSNSRLGLAIPAYLHPDFEGTVVPARTTNLSVGGFHCLTDLPVSVGNNMDVSLMFTPTEAFDCRAQVVRLSDDPDDPSHRQIQVAFRFIDLTVADEARVAEALAALEGETDATAIPSAWRSGDGRTGLPG